MYKGDVVRRNVVALRAVCVGGAVALLGLVGCGKSDTKGVAPPASISVSGTPSPREGRPYPYPSDTDTDAARRPSA